MTETWKEIPGFEGYYQASDLGRIMSMTRIVKAGGERPHEKLINWRILKPSWSHGYHSYVLWKDHVGTTIRAHSAVAYAFLGLRPEGAYVCHRDGDRANNCLSNLYYGTPTENVADARRHGTLAIGEKAGAAKLTSQDVKRIREMAKTHAQREISDKFGISQAQVSRVINGSHWRHIDIRARKQAMGMA